MPRVEDYETLKTLSGLRGKSVAVQAREFVLAGLREALDPDEIERRMDEEKRRMLRMAAELRRPTA